MKRIFLLSLGLLTALACQSQEKTKPHKNETQISAKTPKGNYTVKKQYDENGNLVSIDSTYTYSSAMINGKPASRAQIDSLMQRMKSHMDMSFGNKDFADFSDLGFGNFFGDTVDSTQTGPLIGQALNQHFNNLQKQMIQRMRAIQKRFMESGQGQQFLIPPDPKKEDAPKKEKEEKTPPIQQKI